jgi:hypothetical protein
MGDEIAQEVLVGSLSYEFKHGCVPEPTLIVPSAFSM